MKTVFARTRVKKIWKNTSMINKAFCALLISLLTKTSWSNEVPKQGQSYCIFHPSQSIKYSPNHHGTIGMVEGNHLVFTFGVKGNPKLDLDETRYLVEVDSGCSSFSTAVSGKCHPLLFRWNVGEGENARIDTGKVEGVKASDSTWIIHERISSEYRAQFATMPYRVRKNDKRIKTGLKRVCKEYLQTP